jgi:hypothetical protein
MIQRCTTILLEFADVILSAGYNIHMSHRLTIRLTDELLAWLKELSGRTGLPIARIICQQLEIAKATKRNQRFLGHAGEVKGPKDLSSRRGFSRKRS